jgi:SAM-dependent methyltransferase
MSRPAGIERWNTRFATDEYIFGEAPNAFLVAAKPFLPAGGKALAVADGEGRNGVWLAEQGFDVLAFDAAPTALEKARRLAAKRGVAVGTLLLDIEDVDWTADRFDVVAAIFIQFAPPPLRDAIFAGLRAALVPGGVLVLEGYRPKQLDYGTGGPSQVENLYTRELLTTAFAELDILHLEERDVVLEEGSGHRGMSAVIDLVARKPTA